MLRVAEYLRITVNPFQMLVLRLALGILRFPFRLLLVLWSFTLFTLSHFKAKGIISHVHCNTGINATRKLCWPLADIFNIPCPYIYKNSACIEEVLPYVNAKHYTYQSCACSAICACHLVFLDQLSPCKHDVNMASLQVYILEVSLMPQG